MSLSKIARPLMLLTMLSAIVLGGANRSFAGIIFSATNNSYTNVFTNKQDDNTTIIGMVDNSTPEIYLNGFSSVNNSVNLSSKSGVASVSAASNGNNLRILTLTAQTGFGISAMNWSLFSKDNEVSGNLIFNAYDANNQLIALSSGVNNFNWGKGANQFDFTTDSGSLVSRLEIFSSKDIGDIKQVSVNVAGIQSVPEPTSTLAFAGVAAVCGLYRLRRRNRKAAK